MLSSFKNAIDNVRPHGKYDKYIIGFGGSAVPQDKPDKQIVGGKGLGLQEMSRIGIDVPPGFTLTTDVCQLYEANGALPDEMWQKIIAGVKRIEKDMGKQFGSVDNPLLFSCRSGAAISMPGMMDTVLDIVSYNSGDVFFLRLLLLPGSTTQLNSRKIYIILALFFVRV